MEVRKLEDFLRHDNIDNEIDPDKRGVSYYSTFEAIEKIIDINPKYLKSFLSAENRIVKEIEIQVTNKELFKYKSFFAHNAEPLTFVEERLVFTIEDYEALVNRVINLEVYVDGVLLNPKDYTVKRNLGSNKIYIVSSKVSEGSLVTFILKESFNKEIKYHVRIVNTEAGSLSYQIDKSLLGDFFDNVNNLAVYKKGLLDTYPILLTENEDYLISITDNMVNVMILSNVLINEEFLVMNILSSKTKEITLDGNISDLDYMEAPLISVDLVSGISVHGYSLPFPVKDETQLEIFVNGYKLIPFIDYVLETSDGSFPNRIKFVGMIRKDAYILIKTRPFDEKNNYVIDNSLSANGFIDLVDSVFPLHEDYTEVYVSRKRVMKSNKKILGDCIVKLDNLKNLEMVEVMNSNLISPNFLKITDGYAENKTDIAKYIEYRGFDNFITEYSENNEVKMNSVVDELYPVFMAKLVGIELHVQSSTIIQGSVDQTFIVLGIFDNGENIDITYATVITGYDPHTIGTQTIVATFDIGTQTFQDSKIIEVIGKTLEELTITVDKVYIDIGETPIILVTARYNDFSTKDVTDDSIITISPEDLTIPGSHTISALYEENGITVDDTFEIMVGVSEDRVIENLIVIPKVSILDPTTDAELNVFIYYTDHTIKPLGTLPITITGFDPLLRDVEQTIVISIEDSNGTTFTQDKTIIVFDNNLSNISTIITADDVSFSPITGSFTNGETYIKIKDESNNYLSVGDNNLITENVAYFATIENQDLVIVELYNDVNELVDSDVYIVNKI